jgi:hypothetical protein
MPGDRPEAWPAGLAAIGVPVHRIVLAEPGELLVRRAAALVDVGIDEVDLWRHVSALPRPGIANDTAIAMEPVVAGGTLIDAEYCS